MEEKGFNLFGFTISKKSEEKEKKIKSIVTKRDDDGSVYASTDGLTHFGSHYAHYIDQDGSNTKDSIDSILQYRNVSSHPEVDAAIEDITNEAISGEKYSIEINLENLKHSANVKKKIKEEFDNVVSMLCFNELGHDIFRRWYIDGRLFHHLVIDENNPRLGIQDIRPIDATKITKVKEVVKKQDEKTGVTIIDKVKEYFVFQEKGIKVNRETAIRLNVDSVSYITSGLLDETKRKVISYLHKALKPINQLRMMEDSLVIYRLARAPERRIFYIDVGNLPKGKSEEYLKNIMARYRNKIVYDATTGKVKDDRKHQSLLEDFWLPRKEGSRGTEISTLPGGQNLGEIEDIIYFQKKVYNSLNVPANRLEQESQFTLGRASEISRDEFKFQKFIDRLRSRFAFLFIDILRVQLLLKGIIAEEDWDNIKSDISVDFSRDNYFTELKNSEILRERIETLNEVSDYIGEYFTRSWVMKNVLKLTDEEIASVDAEKAKNDGDDNDNESGDDNDYRRR